MFGAVANDGGDRGHHVGVPFGALNADQAAAAGLGLGAGLPREVRSKAVILEIVQRQYQDIAA